MLEGLKKIDQEVFLALNGFHTEWMDQVMVFISDKYVWIPLYLILLVLIIRHYKIKALFILIAIGLLIFASDQLSVHLFKENFQRLRPCHEPALEGLAYTVNNKCGGQYGFISSHATNAFALTVFIIGIFIKRLKVLLWVMLPWAIFNAYSRVYLGVHYPGDVLVGAIFGSLIGFVFLKTYLYFQAQFINSK